MTDPHQVARPTARALHEVIADGLRSDILSGRRLPGTPLGEVDIAGEYGGSRNPVREALRILQAEGFVTSRRSYGAVVAFPDSTEIAEMLEARAALEPMLARRAATRRTPEQLVDLHAILIEAQEAISREDYQALTALNMRFHRWIGDASGNRPAGRFISQMLMKLAWTYATGTTTRGPDSWREHAELAACMEAGDPDRAEQLMWDHMGAAVNDFRYRFSRNVWPGTQK